MRLLCAAILLLLTHPAAAGEVPIEIELTPEMQRGVALDIQARGYNCPDVKLAFAREPNAYGNVIQVICGPPDREIIYKRTSFRFTYHPNGGVSIEPCSFLHCKLGTD